SCSNVWVQSGVVSTPYTSITTAPTTFPPPDDLRLYFNATTDVNISSVSLRPTTYCCNSAIDNKTITVGLFNNSGVLQTSASATTCTGCEVTVGGNPTINLVVPLNFTVPAGSTGWYLAVTSAVSWSPGFLNQTKTTVTQAGVISFLGDNSSSSMGPFYNVAYSGRSINSCNPRVAESSCCPAPVTWISFTGDRTGNGTVLLNWSTGIEENSKVFYIQRSLDGVTFETIGEVAAAGNSNQVTTYSYTDLDAPKGNVYYRLNQADIDGASMFSKIVYINGITIQAPNLVPNPGNGSFSITGLSGDTKLNVTVYTITGQLLYNTITYPGELIDLVGLAKGFYIIKILAGNTEQSIRYINQ
ncbi:MAG TPA: T9SS type A sorting domain-containing protein, partial [Cytophagaceae bacterium]|nr:T9SS type A sorting domain-containing protein [Cytophagaceae bacterium]